MYLFNIWESEMKPVLCMMLAAVLAGCVSGPPAKTCSVSFEIESKYWSPWAGQYFHQSTTAGFIIGPCDKVEAFTKSVR